MNEKIKTMYEKLSPKDRHEEEVAAYIAWQLDSMKDTALAETTAAELTKGVFTLSGAVGAVREAAKNGICSDEDGYRAVRKYLKIDGAVTEAEAALYFIRKFPKNTIIELLTMIREDAPTVAKSLDLGLDDLFG